MGHFLCCGKKDIIVHDDIRYYSIVPNKTVNVMVELSSQYDIQKYALSGGKEVLMYTSDEDSYTYAKLAGAKEIINIYNLYSNGIIRRTDFQVLFNTPSMIDDSISLLGQALILCGNIIMYPYVVKHYHKIDKNKVSKYTDMNEELLSYLDSAENELPYTMIHGATIQKLFDGFEQEILLKPNFFGNPVYSKFIFNSLKIKEIPFITLIQIYDAICKSQDPAEILSIDILKYSFCEHMDHLYARDPSSIEYFYPITGDIIDCLTGISFIKFVMYNPTLLNENRATKFKNIITQYKDEISKSNPSLIPWYMVETLIAGNDLLETPLDLSELLKKWGA